MSMDEAGEVCRKCGEYMTEIREGSCVNCHEADQFELDDHNLSYDRWKNLSHEEREQEIKRASR